MLEKRSRIQVLTTRTDSVAHGHCVRSIFVPIQHLAVTISSKSFNAFSQGAFIDPLSKSKQDLPHEPSPLGPNLVLKHY